MLRTVLSFSFTAPGMARSSGRTFCFAWARSATPPQYRPTGLGGRRHICHGSTDLERHIGDLVSHIEMEDLKRCQTFWSGKADRPRAHRFPIAYACPVNF